MTAYRAELLGPLAALGLGPAEEVGQLRIPLTFGVLDIGLQAQGVAQAGLGEPDDVVVLVLGAGDVPGLVATGHVRLPRALLRPPPCLPRPAPAYAGRHVGAISVDFQRMTTGVIGPRRMRHGSAHGRSS